VQFIHDTFMTPAIVEEFIDGRELYCGVMGQRSPADVSGVGNVVRKMPEKQLEDRHRARQVERQVPEEARHRHALAGLTDEQAAKVQHSAQACLSRARSVGYARIDLRMKPTAAVRDRSESESAAGAG
jgi:D-alanine-D-alanine ligase